MDPPDPPRLVPAATLDHAALTAVFNAGFSGYPVPMLSAVLRRLGASLATTQHEMRLALSATPPAGSPPGAAAGSR